MKNFLLLFLTLTLLLNGNAVASDASVSFSGQLTHADTDKPINDVKLLLSGVTEEGKNIRQYLSTNEKETFDFDQLQHGQYTLYLAKKGFAVKQPSENIEDKDTFVTQISIDLKNTKKMNIKLHPAGGICGTFKSKKDKTIGGKVFDIGFMGLIIPLTEKVPDDKTIESFFENDLIDAEFGCQCEALIMDDGSFFIPTGEILDRGYEPEFPKPNLKKQLFVMMNLELTGFNSIQVHARLTSSDEVFEMTPLALRSTDNKGDATK